MDKYEVKFYENDLEVMLREIPDDFVRGLMMACKTELAGRARMERFSLKMAEEIDGGLIRE